MIRSTAFGPAASAQDPGRRSRRLVAAPARVLLSIATLSFTIVAFVLLAAGPAAAQDRDSGRRKPPVPKPVAKPQESPAATVAAPVFTAGGERWFVGLGAGLLDAGDLFRVETVNQVVVPWGRAGATWFMASRFTATVDPGSVATVFVGRRLGQGRWWLRGELASGACDVTAEALLGEGGQVYRYDRLSLLSACLAAEARLTAWPSHPYASLGASFCDVSGDRVPELDQSVVGVRGALGYRQVLGPMRLTGEAALSRMTFDLKDFVPTTSTGSQPAVIYDPAGDLWLLEVRLALAAAW